MELSRASLSCILISEELLAPVEAAHAHCHHYGFPELTDFEDSASDHATSRSRRGRGHTSRRAAERAARLALPPPS